MANASLLIPHIFHWEEGVPKSYANQPFEVQFAKAKEKGLHIVPDDKGGPTVCGVILSTYKAYRKLKGLSSPSSKDLVNISADEWFDIYKTMFWDKCGGDLIGNQNVANQIVDWVWTSGTGQLKKVQRLAGVPEYEVDGIMGPKTIYLINTWHPVTLFNTLKEGRENFYKQIVRNNPSQKKFLNGWLNRVRDLEYK